MLIKKKKNKKKYLYKKLKLEKIKEEKLKLEKIKEEELKLEKIKEEELKLEKIKEEKLKKKWKRLIKSIVKDDKVIIKEIFIFYNKIIEEAEFFEDNIEDNINKDNNEDKKLWNFWFPIFNINIINDESEEFNIPWILYICIKSKKYNYSLLKRDNIYKIVIKNEPLVIDYTNKYSTHMIVYSKRTLEYYDIITNDLSNFDQYKYINFNILDNKYKYSHIKNNVQCILHDIRFKLELGIYDDYIIYNYNLFNKKVLMKHSLGPRLINKKIINMLKLNKLNIRLIILRPNEILYNYLI